MKVDLYEKAWMWAAAGIVIVFMSSILFGSLVMASSPPSHVETIDPTTARTDPRFATLGVTMNPDGSATVTALAQMFSFSPGEIHIPADKEVTFRLTTPDVIHGFQIVSTNGNTMVVPGYVSTITTSFAAGEYLIACNEYCGLGHHLMQAKLIAEVMP
jgi:cytochrome c oxidase subunit II